EISFRDRERKHRCRLAVQLAFVEHRVFVQMTACNRALHERLRRHAVAPDRALFERIVARRVVHVLTARSHQRQKAEGKRQKSGGAALRADLLVTHRRPPLPSDASPRGTSSCCPSKTSDRWLRSRGRTCPTSPSKISDC